MKGDEKYAEVFPELLSLMRAAGDNIIHQQCAEFLASILQSLCDQVFKNENLKNPLISFCIDCAHVVMHAGSGGGAGLEGVQVSP